MATKYVLISNQNTNLCIGATQASAGSLVTLTLLGGGTNPLSQWYLDANTGHITLVANPDLYLDVQGIVTQGSQLIVADFVLGRQSQSWNWLGNPPQINNNASPNMVVDNSGGNPNPGNPILIWQANGGVNQKWTKLAVPTYEKIHMKAVAAQV